MRMVQICSYMCVPIPSLTCEMAFGIKNGMKTGLTIDAAGRVVLPKPVRRQMHLARGSIVDMEVGPETIVLRPRVRRPTLVEEGGLLVHEGEPDGDLVDAVEQARQRRDRDLAEPMA